MNQMVDSSSRGLSASLQQNPVSDSLASGSILRWPSQSSLYIVGTYQDVFEISDSGFAIKDRRVIVDSFGIDNMLAVPV